MRGELYTDVSVVFEDVRFHRATNLPKDGMICFVHIILIVVTQLSLSIPTKHICVSVKKNYMHRGLVKPNCIKMWLSLTFIFSRLSVCGQCLVKFTFIITVWFSVAVS